MYPLAELNNVKEVCVSIQGTKLDFCVTRENRYGCNSFLEETIG